MTLHLMIDLETLGTGPDCVILQIAAVPFDLAGLRPKLHDFFLPRLDIDEQLKLGRKIEDGTLRWWATGHADKFGVIMSTRVTKTFYEALSELCAYIKRMNPDCIWSHGATFDIPILTHAFYQSGLEWPCKYNCFRDTRTLLWMKDISSFADLPETNENSHNALADANYQARCVSLLLGS